MSGQLIVFTNAAEGRDDEYNNWYDSVHIPEILALEPFTSAQRFRVSENQIFPQTHKYVALYNFEGDADLASKALSEAAPTLQMSDSMVDPLMIVVEPLGPAQG
ncbi:MAG: hypothetical protein JWL73_3572 [Actinomycetia bacterium]|nr:hypothetical protein [Actinomycetes bacterium]